MPPRRPATDGRGRIAVDLNAHDAAGSADRAGAARSLRGYLRAGARPLGAAIRRAADAGDRDAGLSGGGAAPDRPRSWQDGGPPMRRVLRTLAVLAVLGALAGGAVVGFGLYNVSSRAGHLPGVSWVLHTTFRNSVRLRASRPDDMP